MERAAVRWALLGLVLFVLYAAGMIAKILWDNRDRPRWPGDP